MLPHPASYCKTETEHLGTVSEISIRAAAAAGRMTARSTTAWIVAAIAVSLIVIAVAVTAWAGIINAIAAKIGKLCFLKLLCLWTLTILTMTKEIFQIKTLAEHCLRVIKQYREALLINCIVMINKSSVRLLLRINAVRPGRELVCVLHKVDVQGWGEPTSRIFSNKCEELFVFINRAFEYCLGEWALDLTSAMHFLSKFELTLDSGD
jgi:hypothetical protein